MMSRGKLKVCITGSSGMIASEFILKYKHEFEILALTSNPNLNIPGVLTVHYDLKNFDSTTQEILLFNPEIIINSAFYLSSGKENKEVDQFVNGLKFTNFLLNVVSKLNHTHWIEMRSFSEYKFSDSGLPVESPSYLYSVYKSNVVSLIHWYSKLSNMKVTELVLFSVYGKKSKNKKIIDYLIKSFNSESPVELSSGNQKLDFVHISDVIDSIIHSIKYQEKRIWVGTGKATSIKDLARLIESLFKTSKLNITWDENKDRPNDIYLAKAPCALNKTWSSSIDLYEGVNLYLENLNYK